MRPISGEEERVLLAFGRHLSGRVSLALSGRLSPASVAAYQSDIRLFAENTPGLDLFRIAEAQEDAYIEMLHRMRRTERTLQRKGTALRYFREFLADSGLRGKSLRVSADPITRTDSGLVADGLRLPNSKSVIDRTLRAFVQSIRQNRRSRSTVRAYTSDLLKFRQYLQRKTGWQHVSRQLISDFLNEQIASGLNANSAVRLLSTIRSLFRWLQQNGHTLGDPTLGLRLPRAQKHSPVPSVKDLSAMVSANPHSLPALRDVLIFELLYTCGLRVSEISALDISSVDLTQGKLMVRGQHDRQRYVDLLESTARVLIDYLVLRGEIAESRSLMTNLRGGRLTGRSIGRIITQMADSGRLPEGTHPQSLRRAGASHSLKSGKKLQDIRHDLGISGVSAALNISGASD
jgi:integrase/recombinase XerC